MTTCKVSQGFEFSFTDEVPTYLYCNCCTLVAKKLNITTCCGESYCHTCISDILKEGKPCPTCGEEEYDSVGQIKNQKQIASLQIYCSMKERGCDWSGLLKQLDTHLDSEQGNCMYVDTKCPLNCPMAIPRNQVEQHVTQNCVKRPHVCQHCNFKATYEEIVEKHLAECKYVSLQCPNMCGVTFERDFQEDHMKMCRLEEVQCEFSKLGCCDRFKREDQEEHIRQNSQKHLNLTASLVVETKNLFQEKLQELNNRHREEEEELRKKIQEQGEKIELLEHNFVDQKKYFDQSMKAIETSCNADKKQLVLSIEEKKQELQEMLTKQEQIFHAETSKLRDENQRLKAELQQQSKQLHKKIEEQEKQLQEYKSLQDKVDQALKKLDSCCSQHEVKLDSFSKALYLNHSFVMKDFSVEKAKDNSSDWKSPVMYTHGGGYKFYIAVRIERRHSYYYNQFISELQLWCASGDYDNELTWPVKAKFTIELVNQRGGENAVSVSTFIWNKPVGNSKNVNAFEHFSVLTKCSYLAPYRRRLRRDDIDDYLIDDTLQFNISEVRFL